MSESQEDVWKRYLTRAVAYPNVDHSNFVDSFTITVGKDEAGKADSTKIVDNNGFACWPSDNPVRLAGAEKDIDTYDVTFQTKDGEKVTLRDRVPLVGFGSNTAPEILKTKFADCAKDTEHSENNQIVVMQSNLQDHVVVAAAFYSDIGPVPATLHRKEGDSTSVTVGFYTKAQAETMTGTEQSYAGVELDTKVILKGGIEIKKPLAYVSVWGALTDKDGSLMANPSIPQKTDLPRVETTKVIERAMAITDPEMDDIETYMKGHMMGLPGLGEGEIAKKQKTRYERTEKLREHAVKTNVIGSEVFPASIYRDAPFANAPGPTFRDEDDPPTENDPAFQPSGFS